MPDRAAVVFVRVVTAALAAAGVWFVAHFGSHVPVMDEWDLLAEWLGSDSTARWLVSHHNEHRYPLTKLLWLGGLRLTGFDTKPLLYVPLGLLVAAAWMLTRAARALRGRQHPVDAVIPALLLHWGHGFNWLMAYQLGFALVAWAVAGWVWCAAAWAAGGSRGRAASVAFAAMLVPCGGFGVVFAPGVVGWCAWVAWRCRGPLGAAAAIVGLVATAYTGWVVATTPPTRLTTTGIRPDADPVGFAAATADGLCVALGTWPAREPEAVRLALAAVMLTVYGAAAVRLATRGNDPFRAAAVAVLSGCILTAAATAYARGAGYTERMSDASAAGLAVALFAATATWPGRRPALGAVIAGGVVAVVFGVNVAGGAGYATAMRQSAYRVDRDIRRAEPPLLLVGRHGHSLSVLVGERMGESLVRLKAAGIRPFTGLADDPALVSHPVRGALPSVVTAGEYPLPRPPAGARFLRLRVVSTRVAERERVLLRWADGSAAEEEAWVPPLPLALDLVYPLPERPTDPVLRVGPGVREVEVLAVEYLSPPTAPGTLRYRGRAGAGNGE